MDFAAAVISEVELRHHYPHLRNAQLATLSRVTRSHQLGVETDEEILVSRTFCERAGRRVRNNLSYIEHSDDVAMHQIAREVLRAGRYPFVLGGRDGGNP